MRHRQLEKVLRNIVSITLAGAAGAAALASEGCGSSSGGGPTLGQGMTPACPLGNLLEGFTPGKPVDYLATRTEFLPLNAQPPAVDAGADGGDGGDGGATADAGAPSDGWSASIGQQRGTPCATATDPSCKQRLAELRLASNTACPPSGEGFDRTIGQSKLVDGTGSTGSGFGGEGARQAGCSVSYLVYTRGDEIGVARTRAEIVALLAPIDAKEEALYLASGDGLSLSCGQDPKAAYTATPGGGFEVLGETQSGCTYQPAQVEQVLVKIAADGTRTVVSRAPLRQTSGGCAEGRRPHGLASDGSSPACLDELGAYFARAAHLEAASVVAFEQLERELAALGAPERLLRAMRRAQREEIAHAEVTTRLARRFGAEPVEVRVRGATGGRRGATRGAGAGRVLANVAAGRAGSRSAVAIALENAREGCVRETLGAVIALHRAERAADPEIARAYRAISDDELRHARVSWDLAAWLDTQLSPAERRRVRRAFAQEIRALRADLAGEPSREIASLAGAPREAALRAMFAELERSVWREALPFAA